MQNNEENHPENDPNEDDPENEERDENRKKIQDPCKNVQEFFEKEKAIKEKLSMGRLKNMTREEIVAHRSKLSRYTQMMRAMASGNTDTAFVLDRRQHRANVIPADHTLSVVQAQKPITPELVGDSEISSFLKTQYDVADAERNNGLHKNSIKIHMLPFADSIAALPAEDHQFILEHLNPRYAYDAEDDVTQLEKIEGAKRQTAIVNEADSDYWTELQKISRLFPALLAGGSGTCFRGNNASEKIFMLLFMAITGLSEVPEVGSDLAKTTAADFFKHFFVHTNKKVEPLAAIDGFPVKKGSSMSASIEAGEVHTRQASDSVSDIKCELVYTCSFADATLKPYQAWCPESTDFRDVQRVSVRLLDFILDLSKRLLGPNPEHVPFLIQHAKVTNPKCTEVFNTAKLSESICSDPSVWRHPTSDSPKLTHSQSLDMLRSWANSPYTNPSIKIITMGNGNPVESSKVLFYSKQREQEMVEETLLRVTAYDTQNKTTALLGSFRSGFIPILGKIVCHAAGIDAGNSSMVVHNDSDPVAASVARATPKSRKRKVEDDKYVTLMDFMQTVSTKIDTVGEHLDSLKTEIASEMAKNKKFREAVRPKLRDIQHDLGLIKNEMEITEVAEEAEEAN